MQYTGTQFTVMPFLKSNCISTVLYKYRKRKFYPSPFKTLKKLKFYSFFTFFLYPNEKSLFHLLQSKHTCSVARSPRNVKKMLLVSTVRAGTEPGVLAYINCLLL